MRQTNPAILKPEGIPPQRGFDRLTEPDILFPALAILVLAVIWITTLNFIKANRENAGHAATLLIREMISTYEAQAVRALHEIDQTLKVVKFAYETRNSQNVLMELKAKNLLPPDLLFSVSISDSNGEIVASSRPPETGNVSGENFFGELRQNDAFTISRLRTTHSAGEPQLQFSRRINATDGSFAGTVTVSVDASYFTSGYEQSKLGKEGVLGLLGVDGIFLIKRIGDIVSADNTGNYVAAEVTNHGDSDGSLITSSWDGIRRYTSARKLYDFPLTVIVGLSEQEQLAGSNRTARLYLGWATFSSALLILFISVLGYMSWLARSRQHALETEMKQRDRLEREAEIRLAELRMAKEHAETASRAKSQFLSSMSHELRTPLNAILGFSQLLKMDATLNANQRDDITEIVNAGQHLLEMITEILDLSRIETGNIQMSIEPVACDNLAETCLTLVRPMARSRGIHFVHDNTSDIFVQADPTRLKQVLINLLSNAVKYNRENGQVRLHAAPVHDDVVRIMVTDTGVGIPAERLHELFQPFNRLGAESGVIEGTGIGLTISKRLMELMGGRIGVESKAGTGSTFWVELPRTAEQPQPDPDRY